MKNILITGGTSFIGINLLKRLIEADNNIFLVVRPDSDKLLLIPKSSKINIIELDMNDYCYLDDYISEKIDVFYSFAWSGTRGNSRHDKNLQISNYVASMEALEFAIQMGCKHAISAGSQAQYGIYNSEISEDTICNPVTEYGNYKLKFYHDAYKLCKENYVSFKEPRFFSIYGPGDYEESMVNSVIRSMLQNKDCSLTECTQIWNYLYIDDAIDALLSLTIITCDDGAYNVASLDTRALKEFIQDIYRLVGNESKLNFGDIPYPPTGIVSLRPNISKLRNETGWIPRISFEEGINLTIGYLMEILDTVDLG